MRLDVRGAISNGTGWKWFSDSEGNPATKADATAWLLDRLAEGKRFLPIGNCEGFDYATGTCPGHGDAPVTKEGERG